MGTLTVQAITYICLLNDILLTVQELPSIITLSETRLRDNNVYNISITGYEFISKASKTNADTLNFIKRPDLEITLDGVETCFIELPRVKQNHVVIGCIYRHPHITQGYEVYIAGDINQDFFSLQHRQANLGLLGHAIESRIHANNH